MRDGGRYKAQGVEAEFEPGSRGRVLQNLAGIRSVREMARRESEALLAATERSIDETSVEQRFTAEDVCRMHRLWLGEIYPWTGAYRQVNMEKDGFPFAAANQVPRLMQELEREALQKFTPCRFDDAGEQAYALGVVHAELILIHPFREGNGRCARLLATLMALQANFRRWISAGYAGMRSGAILPRSKPQWAVTTRQLRGYFARLSPGPCGRRLGFCAGEAALRLGSCLGTRCAA